MKLHSFPLLTGVPGLLGFFAGNAIDDDEDSYIMITLWSDLVEALRKWAGG